MKLKPVKTIPILIALVVIGSACLLRLLQFDPMEKDQRRASTSVVSRFRNWLQLDFFERLERMTYDMRVREALKFTPSVATNLGFVFLNDASIHAVLRGKVGEHKLGYYAGLYWPRHVFGRAVQELADQGAKAIAFDVIFGELRPDHFPVNMSEGRPLDSDEFFGLQMRHASNVILAITENLDPPAMFRTNAMALGDIRTDKDSPEGILRRVRAFRTYRQWHPAFQFLAADPEYGVDLNNVRLEKGQLILRRDPSVGDIPIPLDENGEFEVSSLGEGMLPPGMAPKAKPFVDERVWHMGVVLAAQELGLDLNRAEVDLANGHIILRGKGGVERTIPTDPDGYFYIDWCLPPDSPALTKEGIELLLDQNASRIEGRTEGLTNRWRGKLAVIGSSATGNDLTDRGATPLRENTLLVSKHWNVANSIITGRFVRRAPMWLDLALIVLLGVLAAGLTWELRVLLASGLVVLLAVAYVVVGIAFYIQTRYWIPLVLPVMGGLVMSHVSLVTWRVIFEQAERRRVRSIFSKAVSPKIVKELLEAETLALGGTRREITVMFADVRGFTEFTDTAQERVAELVARHKLDGAAAEACYDKQARETLDTVNRYLGLIADIIKKQDGTLDKFIGDCVMAFWGAPAPNPKHALNCVTAAIEAQRGIFDFNAEREQQNKAREQENIARIAAGEEPLPPLPTLLLGTGINTGPATAGLMGSADLDQFNYTVFGREVNLASRLEGASGRGRIFISETTYQHLVRDDPVLASSCVPLEPLKVKGFRSAVKVFEVPWRPAEGTVPEAKRRDPEVSTATAAQPAVQGG